MKKIIFTAICLILPAIALMAQGFSYQAVLRNSDGSLRANEPVTLNV